MRTYIILALSLFCPLHCMNLSIEQSLQEWDAHAYDKGCKLQTAAFLHFLKANKINTHNRTILNIECRTGNIAALLARNAQSIHCCDTNENMIKLAQEKHGDINNLSFEQCYPEDFQSKKRYQLALAPFCLHWINNKQQVFKRMSDSLETDGELFATIHTSNNKRPNELAISLNIFSDFIKLNASINTNVTDLFGVSYPSHEELNSMITDTGFTIVTYQEQSVKYKMSEEQLKNLYWPIFTSRPAIKLLHKEQIEPFFDQFFNFILQQEEPDQAGKYYTNVATTILHARKV